MFEEDLQVRAERTDSNRLIKRRDNGEVAERSIAADCKSAAQRATEVRTLPSPPNLSARGVRGLFGLVALSSGGKPHGAAPQ